MKNNQPQLVQTSTSDNLLLHGFFIPSSNKKEATLHIHGFEGNFYENYFVHLLASGFQQKELAFLSVNTRGNSKETEFKTTAGEYKIIGARYELLEEAHLDISAWIEFLLNQGYQTINLMGHSLGTYKVVRYLFEGKHKDKINKLVLLAPFDKKGILISTGRATVETLLNKAQQFVDQGKQNELINSKFDDIVLSYKTFISWYKQDDLSRVFEFCSADYDFPVLQKIQVPTKIIVGSKDEYFHLTNPDHPEEAMNLMLKKIPHARGVIIPEVNHSYSPHEDQMVKEVLGFINST